MRPVEEPSCRRLCHEGRDQAPEVPRYTNLRPVHSKVVHSFAVHGTKLEPIPQPCANGTALRGRDQERGGVRLRVG